MLAAVQRPISLNCITVPVGRPLWKDIPSWFLIAEDDRMIAPETQRYMAERMKANIRSHAVDHTPSVTAATVAMGQYVLRSVRAGRPFWSTFFRGGSDPLGGADEKTTGFSAPLASQVVVRHAASLFPGPCLRAVVLAPGSCSRVSSSALKELWPTAIILSEHL